MGRAVPPAALEEASGPTRRPSLHLKLPGRWLGFFCGARWKHTPLACPSVESRVLGRGPGLCSVYVQSPREALVAVAVMICLHVEAGGPTGAAVAHASLRGGRLKDTPGVSWSPDPALLARRARRCPGVGLGRCWLCAAWGHRGAPCGRGRRCLRAPGGAWALPCPVFSDHRGGFGVGKEPLQWWCCFPSPHAGAAAAFRLKRGGKATCNLFS